MQSRISSIFHTGKRNMTGDKSEVRIMHKELRDAMGAEQAAKKSRSICEKLTGEDWYQEARVIYAYDSLGNEVDCRSFLEKALLDGKNIALPRTAEKDFSMEFCRIESFSQLHKGNFQVREPKKECPVLQEETAIVLVPGVVFDKHGNRYGYGKGYYDRYFYRFPNLRRFALAYEHQLEQNIETNPTDIKMHRIYTEAGVYRFE